MADRWDWWNEGKDPAKKPQSWQPLTEEERARVVVVPISRRVRLSQYGWRNARHVDYTKSDGIQDDAHGMGSNAPEMMAEIEITEMKRSKNTDRRKGMSGVGRAPTYTYDDVMEALRRMVNHYGRMPSMAEIKAYAKNDARIPSLTVFVKRLGTKDTWQDKLDGYLRKHGLASRSKAESGTTLEAEELPDDAFAERTEPSEGMNAEEMMDDSAVDEAEPDETDAVEESDSLMVPSGANEVKEDDSLAEIMLSGTAKFTVRVDGKAYLFAAGFEDLRPIAIEDQENAE